VSYVVGLPSLSVRSGKYLLSFYCNFAVLFARFQEKGIVGFIASVVGTKLPKFVPWHYLSNALEASGRKHNPDPVV